eukprot:767871-Hanusia_phi.AAC.1
MTCFESWCGCRRRLPRMYRALPFFMCFVAASGFLPSVPQQGKFSSLSSALSAPPALVACPTSCLRTCPPAPRCSRAWTVRMSTTAGGGENLVGSDQVCFDGGCVVEDSSTVLQELEQELLELSETEKRLRREGALMLLDKIRSSEAEDAAPPRPSPPAPPASPAPPAAQQSVISRKLQGRDGPTVWSEFGALAAQKKCVNLGQGFPDWSPPPFVRDAAVEAIMKGTNQYTRTAGHLPLARTLAARYSMHLEQEVRAETEVAVTVGASQALYVSLQSLLEEGDEVLLMEPFFDLYLGQILLAGGKPVYVPLEPSESGEWRVEMRRVEEKVNERTRVIILNSPHNPTGKVFSMAEMEALAEIVRKNDRLVVISDEVYKVRLLLYPPSPPPSSSNTLL